MRSTVSHWRSGWWLAGALYLLFFLALFAQMPLAGRIPGNTDVWLGMVLANTALQHIFACFTGEAVGMAMYPAGQVFAYGESTPISLAMYMLWRLISGSDLFAVYATAASNHALAGLGVFLLARYLLWRLHVEPIAVSEAPREDAWLEERHWIAAFFAGFAYSCSNVLFAHGDDSILVTFVYLPACLAVISLCELERTRELRWACTGGLFAGLQAWLSVYAFAWQCALLMVLALVFVLRRGCPMRLSLLSLLALAVSVLMLAASPLIAFYLHASMTRPSLLNWEVPWIIQDFMGIRPQMLVRALEGNLLWGWTSTGMDHLGRRYEHFFSGLLLALLALAGMWRGGLLRRVALAFVGVGLFFSVSGSFAIFGVEIPSPMYVVYEHLEAAHILRFPYRAWFLVLIGLAILSSLAAERLLRHIAQGSRLRATGLLLGLTLIHVLENVPFPLPSFDASEFIDPPPGLLEFLNTRETKEVVLHMPSTIALDYEGFDPALHGEPHQFLRAGEDMPPLFEAKGQRVFLFSGADLFQHNREYMYQLWQTRHGHHIVNGVHGYYPVSRLIMQRFMERLPDDEALRWLRRQGVSVIVWHHELQLMEDHAGTGSLRRGPHRVGYPATHPNHVESVTVQSFRLSSLLEHVWEDDDIVVFRIREESAEESDTHGER